MSNKMNVIVQSTLSGRAAGFHEVSVSKTNKVNDLISAYCVAKGIPQRSYYILRTGKNIPLDSIRSIESYSSIEDGETVFLGNKTDEDTMFGFNNWWIVAFMSLLIGGVGLVSIILVYVLDVPKTPENYSVVMDAGSTHTMSYLYNWKTHHASSTADVHEVSSCKNTGGGISSYIKNPDLAGSSLSACISKIKHSIPTDDIATTQLYLGATAGMRLLNLSSEATALKVMYSVTTSLSHAGMLFQSADIISGAKEGEYAWITLNYLNKNFEHIKTAESHHTVGSLDLGGASTQIAYEVDKKNSTSTVNVQLFNNDYNVHSQSFLCYGLSQSHLRFFASLIKDPTSKQTVYKDPCSPKGHSIVMTPQQLYADNPCTQSHFVKKNLKTIMQHANYTFEGQSDGKQCSALVNVLFNQTKCLANFSPHICFQGVPHFKHSRFLAISGFYSALEFLNATDVALHQFQSIVDGFCSKSWSQLKPYLHNKYITRYCYDAKYIHHLLIDGYAFNSTSWPNIVFTNQISGNDLGWALGFMLEKTNSLMAKKAPPGPISVTAFGALIGLFNLFILVAIGFGCHAMKQKKQKYSYERSGRYQSFSNTYQ